ncbi:hypothetical protein SS1G_08099 [Sclerotinia sclerotiorum 1980 UF-70]|uniref:Acyltransferase C-terminal domain-containing protein n=1 Tax=Sclerotinia sclerotiorum (strain ATCC 18683 / 1980 / Ss-1) TaxID=665079 RepID=A7ERZ4_SCLS1|nr:hypothetical protein SS1G_08099 [Sclerotinia sclerotiorum 1980 UF-70]EDN92236.1 hypothetical protein SS1G_08099 [Sclerotinia sclerotiorum 1980 UF-70]
MSLDVLYTSIRGFIIVLPWVLELVLMDLMISFFIPVSYLFPNWVYNASSFIAFTNWNWVQVIFEVFNGGKITISGDTLPENETAIVIANHVSWTDFYMIQALAIRAGLISFSEATRYTPKKYEEAKTWCKENNRPLPKHLLYPRTKGFVTTVQHLRKAKHVKAVYDMTIAYSHHNKWHEAPTIWESLSCDDLSGKRGYKFHVEVKRFLLEELPESDAGLAKWLETRWIEKGEYLEEKREEWSRSGNGHKPITA